MEKARTAIKEMELHFKDVHDFLLEQANKLHEHHEQWKQQKEEGTTMAQSNS